MARAGAALLALLLAVGAAGCGEEDGVAEGAVVAVYLQAPLCGPQRDFSVATKDGPNVRIEPICLPNPRAAGKVDLAKAGANARRASEDSTAIAYARRPDPAVASATDPILEAAGIAVIPASTGLAALNRLTGALPDSASGSLRDEVRESLETGD